MPNGGPLIAAPRLPDPPLTNVYRCSGYPCTGGNPCNVHVIARHPDTNVPVGEAIEEKDPANPTPILVVCDVPPGNPPDEVLCEIHCYPAGTVG